MPEYSSTILLLFILFSCVYKKHVRDWWWFRYHAGQIVFELYTYRPASADPKGQQLQTWQLGLAGDRDQRTYWNHTTRMYDFPLQVKLDTWPGGSKFVLLARYNNPWNEHLQDQAILDLAGMVSELKERLRGGGLMFR